MKLKKLICIVMISVLGVLSFAGCAKKQDEKKTETSSEASTQEASVCHGYLYESESIWKECAKSSG